MKKKFILVVFAALSLALVQAFAAQSGSKGTNNADLRKLSGETLVLHVGTSAFTVSLYDNPTAKDLLSKLPLKLKAEDYAGYDEKLIRLNNALSMEGAPRGDEPLFPEVGYYHPGRWIALYYGPIGYWSGKVPLGKIDASIEQLAAIPDNAPVTLDVK
ncbi:cyclophilin-like fold protein [Cohaesibacter haloalkalitolerans]|uniref:cyclophilin-like fold protein n=1 Tax=Cohaesibacter haloalkalitolerans TaxID=1162980 RepID=UPI000E64695B|nr:cyclophilin-like fold protein [Cohaesibacter haloalkalitolerans]